MRDLGAHFMPKRPSRVGFVVSHHRKKRDGWGIHYPDARKRAIPIEGMALFTVSAERRLGGYL